MITGLIAVVIEQGLNSPQQEAGCYPATLPYVFLCAFQTIERPMRQGDGASDGPPSWVVVECKSLAGVPKHPRSSNQGEY